MHNVYKTVLAVVGIVLTSAVGFAAVEEQASCPREQTVWIDTENGDCQDVGDQCSSLFLWSQGYVLVEGAKACADFKFVPTRYLYAKKQNAHFVGCSGVAGALMKNVRTGECRYAKNGCAVDSLSGQGFEVAEESDCTILP